MNKDCYELIYKVTETLQNGNERTIKKSVYSPVYRQVGSCSYYISHSERIALGAEALKERHYYNIELVCIKKKTVIWAE